MGKHNVLGERGEALACGYLRNKGHQVLETNYRHGHKEIDIISIDGSVLVFTEIKARSNYAFGYPEEAVSKRKQRLLLQAAEYYCLDRPEFQKIRFDVLSLLIRNDAIIEAVHFEDAFY